MKYKSIKGHVIVYTVLKATHFLFPPTHSHASVGIIGFNVLPKDTSTCGRGVEGHAHVRLHARSNHWPSDWQPLFLLSYSRKKNLLNLPGFRHFLYQSIHPSIFYTVNPLAGSRGGWSLSQQSLYQSIQFNSVLFILLQIITNVIWRHFEDTIQFKPIRIQFIVIQS